MYRLHVPTGYKGEVSRPLVVVIHGAFSTAREIEEQSGFSKLADHEGFIAVYPEGMGIFGFLQHWNAGHCCGKAAADNIDDVGFIAAVINEVAARLSVDLDRVYMVGFSNGGMLAYRFAAERSNIIAAVAPMAAAIGGRPSADVPLWVLPKPIAKVPAIIFHAMDDDSVPYLGGQSLRHGGEQEYLSVEESIRFWVKHNGCNKTAVQKNLYGGSVIYSLWKDPAGSNDISLYAIKEWGHIWPGKYFTSTLGPENPLNGFDAAEIVWDFFKSRRRPSP